MHQRIDTYSFDSLAGLRDFLNQFNAIELGAVLPQSGEYFVLDWFEETLTDGSSVYNCDIKTPDISLDEAARRLGRP